eukprot:TRINITY_DN9275_c0_g1_i1.p1 TRINITY_DN9275_c0_g1~~TRINITY_DN9275_c0_g1_i1.p1  ORF type:complete len:207 (+),score=54.50 TRINITY_DN9275_c0_g1_i1:108-728(+)
MSQTSQFHEIKKDPVAKQRVDPKSDGLAVKRPITTEDRLILPFVPGACCTAGPGFREEDAVRVPAALAVRDVTEAEWQRFMERYRDDVQSKQWSTCAYVALIFSIVGIPFACYRHTVYQRALRDWLIAFNHDVLVPKGLFSKFQTNAVHSQHYNEEISWLAVALSPEEADQLMNEPVMWTPGCCEPRIRPDHVSSAACCCCAARVV